MLCWGLTICYYLICTFSLLYMFFLLYIFLRILGSQQGWGAWLEASCLVLPQCLLGMGDPCLAQIPGVHTPTAVGNIKSMGRRCAYLWCHRVCCFPSSPPWLLESSSRERQRASMSTCTLVHRSKGGHGQQQSPFGPCSYFDKTSTCCNLCSPRSVFQGISQTHEGHPAVGKQQRGWQRALEEENQQQVISLQVALVCSKENRREGLGQGTWEGYKSHWGCPDGRRLV